MAMIACGSKHGVGGDPDANGDGGGGDDGGPYIDAPPFGGSCVPGAGPQCSNCIDDDGDGDIDGADIECTGPFDNDENSFATGIPGDNMDAVDQDCFFDGNSGAGNDGCSIHVCCLLGAATVADCHIGQNRYHPEDCPPPIGTKPLTQQCIDVCGPLTPPGCDCFACCTLCDASGCYDIATNPATSPECTDTTLADPTKCHRCTQVTTCGNTECGGATCVLCPGQDPTTLPPSCTTALCPAGTVSCAAGEVCPNQTYCSNGCCIGVIQ